MRDIPPASCYDLPNFCPGTPASAGSCRSSIPAQGGEGQFVRDFDAKRLGPLPSASGAITRLAYARAKEAGVDAELLSTRARLSPHQIEDRKRAPQRERSNQLFEPCRARAARRISRISPCPITGSSGNRALSILCLRILGYVEHSRTARCALQLDH